MVTICMLLTTNFNGVTLRFERQIAKEQISNWFLTKLETQSEVFDRKRVPTMN